MKDLFGTLFSSGSFMPHGHCYLWQPGVLWLHILSDALIALAYFSIPFTLVHFIRKRKDLPFNWMFLCFAVFIVSCGMTHLLEIYVIWHPVYWLQGGVKAITALVSVPTAVLLVRLLPQALGMASPTALHREIVEREKTEQKFKGLLEFAPDAMVLVNREGEIVLVNSQTEKLFGYARNELLGKKMEILLPQRFRGQHPSHRGDYFSLPHARPMGAELELFGLGSDGREIPVEICLSPLETAEGTLTISAIRDISRRKSTEATLRESEERFRRSFEDAAIGMALVSLEGRWLRVNRVLHEMVGYTETDLLASDFQTITHPEDLQADLDHVRQLLDGKIRDYKMEKRYLHKHGQVINVLLSVSLVRDTEGMPLYFISQIQDLTGHHKLAAQLLQAQKMDAIGQLAGGVAHDFNNILAVILLQAALLKSEQDLSLQQLDGANEIEKAAQRAANLTRQLLLFSRQQTMKLRDLNLNTIVTNISKMLQRVFAEDVQMQFHLSPQPLLIHADAGMIDQILLNLTVNARDAMPNGGQLIIETSVAEFDQFAVAQTAHAQPGVFACLSVTDTGAGIPPEILPKIFEPFFTTKDVGKGTGLGLATVFGIVQQHQGWINVYSEKGRGTTFQIYLPRVANSLEKQVAGTSLSSVRGGNETILLVEDDSSVRASVRGALVRLRYNVLEAENGLAGLEVWKRHRDEIHLLLTDLIMPGGMNGKELAQRLLQDRPELKIIYASGYRADIAGTDLLLQEGVNFLQKPFEAHKLAQTVRDCLDKN